MDWLISPEVRRFIITHDLFFALLFAARAIGFTALEVLRPARTVFYRKVILYDLAVFAVYQALIFPGALRINHWVAVRPHLPAKFLALPLAVRVLCYLVIADFGHYWIHRLMHYKMFWRIHKWHHAPDYMYWLMGVRTTLPQQVLVNFLDNHDLPRFMFEKSDPAIQRVALTYLMTWDGIPCVYYGTEQGFAGGVDPKNREDMFRGNEALNLAPFATEGVMHRSA